MTAPARIGAYRVVTRKGDVHEVEATSISAEAGMLFLTKFDDEVFVLPLDQLAHAGRYGFIEEEKKDVVIEVPPATAVAGPPVTFADPNDLTAEALDGFDIGTEVFDRDEDRWRKLADSTWGLVTIGKVPLKFPRVKQGTPAASLVVSRAWAPFRLTP